MNFCYFPRESQQVWGGIYQVMFPQRNRNFEAFHPKKIEEKSSKSKHFYVNAIYPSFQNLVNFSVKSDISADFYRQYRVCHHFLPILVKIGFGTPCMRIKQTRHMKMHNAIMRSYRFVTFGWSCHVYFFKGKITQF